jgi:anti-sigma regulatory factor (Ser/Thr protein kinase)
MTKDITNRLSLDRPATYQIKVPGVIDVSRADWAGEMAITVEDEGFPITTMTGDLDQAALHGLLRRLYSLGLPLISVNCINVS